MLGWALKRNAHTTHDTSDSDDTQQYEPETPAPVFAVRALKTAIFGTPAPRSHFDRTPKAIEPPEAKLTTASAKSPRSPPKSPVKLNGILVTPGTSTSRPKRVSFGHDVKEHSGGGGHRSSKRMSLTSEELFTNKRYRSLSRPKSRLTQDLENSRKARSPAPPVVAAVEVQTVGAQSVGDKDGKADEWVDVAEAVDVEQDVTVDLGQPRSASGKYWKSQFDEYHQHAWTSFEKYMVRSSVARSLATKKDAEAIDLQELLEQERKKVAQIERNFSDMLSVVLTKIRSSEGDCDPSMIQLALEAAKATQNHKVVAELEAALTNADGVKDGPDSEIRTRRRRHGTSPRTEQTLLETQRELRRALRQCKELDNVQIELTKLKSELRSHEELEEKLAQDNAKLDSDLTNASQRAKDVEKKLRVLESEGHQKDVDLSKVQAECDTAKARMREIEDALQRKTEQVARLEEEAQSLKQQLAEKSKPGESPPSAPVDQRRQHSGGEQPPSVMDAAAADDETKRPESAAPAPAAKPPLSRRFSHHAPSSTYHHRNANYSRPSSSADKDATKSSSETLREPVATNRGLRDKLHTGFLKLSSALGDNNNSDSEKAVNVNGHDGEEQPRRKKRHSFHSRESPKHVEADAETPTTLRPKSITLDSNLPPATPRPSFNAPDRRSDQRDRERERERERERDMFHLAASTVADETPLEIDIVSEKFARLGRGSRPPRRVWNTARMQSANERINQKLSENARSKRSYERNKENLHP